MIVEDQSPVVAFLSDPATHGATGPVETMETHISRIFLVGDRAFKMKRAVKLPYVDFSTPDRRLEACRREVAFNGETTPELYLGVRAITRGADGGLTLDGDGVLVDAVVEMARFDQAALFDRIALAGGLSPDLMTETARMIVRFHRAAPTVHAGAGADNIAGVLDINEAAFAASGVFGTEAVATLNRAFREALARHAALLDRREAAGKVRRCHGDLHLRNIVLIDGAPRLFDCIEFNDAIATIDTLYDLAFLLMDLWHRGYDAFANRVMNRYLDEADDEDGFPLLPFFMAIRAAVRAHVTATRIADGGDPDGRLGAEARSYFDLAGLLLEPRPNRLIAIGGLSGTGKTTVAEALAPTLGPPPGARIVESDRVRKAMHGVPAETHLPPKAYTPEISERVYAEMAWRAGLILSEGGTVVADAVFDRLPDRERIAGVAQARSIPFCGVWLEADPALLWERVRDRRGGPSDATVDVLSRQLARKVECTDWDRLDAAQPAAGIVEAVLALAAAKGDG
ncbi:aminoglycoside phosphotransferase [Aquibium carbonis]|uniref:Aminoglycoside phosphotransferase n=1 Tax=Aquibium carbonis TaxID=2495581 RepID=A0A429Z308_9HYPH|nr:bifunctional aminoglycoside phosphotransferase/ATP-binding protein [Aquibium carbonis]RST88079.1 aminoglycoside phosphotransferase [Aquibium carbonis]